MSVDALQQEFETFTIAGSGDSLPRKLTPNEYFQLCQLYMKNYFGVGWQLFAFPPQGHYFPKHPHPPVSQDPSGYSAEQCTFQAMMDCNLPRRPFVLFNPCYSGIGNISDGFWKVAMGFNVKETDNFFAERSKRAQPTEICDFIIFDPKGFVAVGEIKAASRTNIVNAELWQKLKSAECFIRKISDYITCLLGIPATTCLNISRVVVLPNCVQTPETKHPVLPTNGFIFYQNQLSNFLDTYADQFPAVITTTTSGDYPRQQAVVQGLLAALVNLQIKTNIVISKQAVNAITRQQTLQMAQSGDEPPAKKLRIETRRQCFEYFLTPEQHEYIQTPWPLVQLLGAPGTGKTLVMELRIIELMKKGKSILCICSTQEMQALYQRFFQDHFDHRVIPMPIGWKGPQNAPDLVLMQTEWFLRRQYRASGCPEKPALLALWRDSEASFDANKYHNSMQTLLAAFGFTDKSYEWMLDESSASYVPLINIAELFAGGKTAGCWIVPFANHYGSGAWNSNPERRVPRKFVSLCLSTPLRYTGQIHGHLGQLFRNCTPRTVTDLQTGASSPVDALHRPLGHKYAGPEVLVVEEFIQVKCFRILAEGIVRVLKHFLDRDATPDERPSECRSDFALLLPRTGLWEPYCQNAIDLLHEVRKFASSRKIPHVSIASFATPSEAVTIDTAKNAASFEWQTVISVVDSVNYPGASASTNMCETVLQYAHTSLSRAVLELIEVRINLGALECNPWICDCWKQDKLKQDTGCVC